MANSFRRFTSSITPILSMIVFVILLVLCLFVFSYILMIAAIIFLALFIIGYIRFKWLTHKARKNPNSTTSQKTGRLIEHDELK